MMAVGGVVLGVIIWSIGWTIGVCCYRYRAKNAKPNVEFSCGRTSKIIAIFFPCVGCCPIDHAPPITFNAAGMPIADPEDPPSGSCFGPGSAKAAAPARAAEPARPAASSAYANPAVQRIKDTGNVREAVHLLRTSQDASTLASCCDVLSQLSSKKGDVSGQAVEMGAVPVVVEILQRPQSATNPWVLEMGLRLLTHLAAGGDARAQLVQCNAQGAAAAAMEAHPRHPGVQASGGELLQHLAVAAP